MSTTPPRPSEVRIRPRRPVPAAGAGQALEHRRNKPGSCDNLRGPPCALEEGMPAPTGPLDTTADDTVGVREKEHPAGRGAAPRGWRRDRPGGSAGAASAILVPAGPRGRRPVPQIAATRRRASREQRDPRAVRPLLRRTIELERVIHSRNSADGRGFETALRRKTALVVGHGFVVVARENARGATWPRRAGSSRRWKCRNGTGARSGGAGVRPAVLAKLPPASAGQAVAAGRFAPPASDRRQGVTSRGQ